ncbi:MAG: hypothetical protein Q8P24_12885 [Desulfobacterales bacterium]|nr:hypothetical protein [Desulfobacterales bacterium]
MRRLIKIVLSIMVCGAIIAAQPFPVLSDPLDPYIQAAKKEGGP